jgi:hypothetical protein
VILNREDIKELHQLGSAEAVLTTPPKVGSVQSVQPAVGVAAVCRVEVSDTWPHRAGGHVVVLELRERLKGGPRPVRRVADKPRLMKRGHGTTSDPLAAWRDNSSEEVDEQLGRPPEPEMVDQETEQRFADAARRNDELRSFEQQRRTLAERVDRMLEAAERLGVDPTRHVAAIDRRITDLEKKLRRAA